LLVLGIGALFLHSICEQAPSGRMVILMSRLPIWTPLRTEPPELRRGLGGPVMIQRYSK
jgi:hypothetical protein